MVIGDEDSERSAEPTRSRDDVEISLDGLTDTQTALRDAIARTVMPTTAWVAELGERMAQQQRAFLEPVRQFAKAFRDVVRRATPENWVGLESGRLGDVVELANSGAVNVVWAPRAEIVAELMEADGQATREAALVARRDEILADVDAVLAASTVELFDEQTEARELAHEAVRTAEAGFDRAAQALLAAALGHVLERTLGFKTMGQARQEFRQRNIHETYMSELRIVCLQRVTVNALESTTRGAEGFNRHGTQHGHPDAFSEASMLAAALLVAGWIRELSWLAEHHPEVFREE